MKSPEQFVSEFACQVSMDGEDEAKLAAAIRARDEEHGKRYGGIPIIIDTPNDVCDGHVVGTISDLQKWYGDSCVDWALDIADLRKLLAATARADRLAEALRQILVGKLQEDNGHPLGADSSMASRFLNIARDAINRDLEGKE